MKGFISLPTGWFETKVDYEYEVTLGKMIQPSPRDEADIPCSYHKSATIQDGQLLVPATGMFASAKEINNLRIQAGDLLVCEGGDIGRSALVEITPADPVIIQNSAHRVRSIGAYPTKWLYYVLKFYKDSGLLDIEITGTNTISHFTNEIFRSMVIPFPPIDFVQKLINILDKKIEKIDEIIDKHQHKLEALSSFRNSIITQAVTKGLKPNVEMKDSGLKWLGDIPNHWHVSTIGKVMRVTLGKMLENKKNGNSYTFEKYLCAGSIDWSGVKQSYFKYMWFSPAEKKDLLLEPNDCLIVEGGAGFGTTATYNGENYPCYFQNSIIRLRDKGWVMSKFSKYWLHVTYNSYLDTVCNKATFSHYTKEKVSATPILIPPLSEQQKIVHYLDKRIELIDNTYGKIENIIKRLSEYRSSLINAAVTGQLNIEGNTYGK